MRPHRILLLAVVLAGCVAPDPAEPDAGAPDGIAAPRVGAAVEVDGAAFASEPDVAQLADGRLAVCAVDRRSGERPHFWVGTTGEGFERGAATRGSGTIDCALGTDAGGTLYLASSAGASVTVAATRDGRAFEHEASLGSGPAYDRPWIVGGAAGEAFVVAYNAASGLEAWWSEDGGASWQPRPAPLPRDALHFQSFSNLVWRGNASFAFAWGALAPYGAALEARDLRLTMTEDAGLTWSTVDIARGRDGNVLNVFPWLAAAPDGSLAVAWAEASGSAGVRTWVARSTDGRAWSEPEAVHGEEETTLMPRVAFGTGGLVVAAYRAEGRLAPNFDAASWGVTLYREAGGAWAGLPVALGVHEGTVATGGYGRLAAEFVEHPARLGTANSQELLHHLGLARLADGTFAVAWAGDADGGTRIHLADVSLA